MSRLLRLFVTELASVDKLLGFEVEAGGGGGLLSKIGLDLGVSKSAGLAIELRPFEVRPFAVVVFVGRNTEANEGSFMRSLRSTEGFSPPAIG